MKKLPMLFQRTSGKVARERLQDILLADRLGCSTQTADRIKDEMRQVLSRHINEGEVKIRILLDISRDTGRGKKHVKTIQIKGL